MTEDPAISYIRHVLATKRWAPSELAKRAKLSPSTINRPLKDPNWRFHISRKTLQAIHGVSGLDPSEFVGDLPESDEQTDLVPIYDIEVSAGNGTIPGDAEDITGQLSFPPGYLRHITSTPVGKLAIVTVHGDSMAPTLNHRDVVMIDTTKRSLGYDGLFVLRMDGALHVKRVNRGSRSGVVRIVSDNPLGYAPFERDISDIDTVGKVLWYGRKE